MRVWENENGWFVKVPYARLTNNDKETNLAQHQQQQETEGVRCEGVRCEVLVDVEQTKETKRRKLKESFRRKHKKGKDSRAKVMNGNNSDNSELKDVFQAIAMGGDKCGSNERDDDDGKDIDNKGLENYKGIAMEDDKCGNNKRGDDDGKGIGNKGEENYKGIAVGDDKCGNNMRGDDKFGNNKRHDDDGKGIDNKREIMYKAIAMGDDKCGNNMRGDDKCGNNMRGDGKCGNNMRRDDKFGNNKRDDYKGIDNKGEDIYKLVAKGDDPALDIERQDDYPAAAGEDNRIINKREDYKAIGKEDNKIVNKREDYKAIGKEDNKIIHKREDYKAIGKEGNKIINKREDYKAIRKEDNRIINKTEDYKAIGKEDNKIINKTEDYKAFEMEDDNNPVDKKAGEIPSIIAMEGEKASDKTEENHRDIEEEEEVEGNKSVDSKIEDNYKPTSARAADNDVDKQMQASGEEMKTASDNYLDVGDKHAERSQWLNHHYHRRRHHLQGGDELFEDTTKLSEDTKLSEKAELSEDTTKLSENTKLSKNAELSEKAEISEDTIKVSENAELSEETELSEDTTKLSEDAELSEKAAHPVEVHQPLVRCWSYANSVLNVSEHKEPKRKRSVIDILRDLRQGLLRSERPLRETAIFYTKDDTYMYDDEVGEGVMGVAMEGGACVGATPAGGCIGPPHHWYDEPPYESDPEDFLIAKDQLRCGIISGEPYVNSLRGVQREEDIISLRTAGDISIPRDVTKTSHTHWAAGGAPGYVFRSPTHSHHRSPTHIHWPEMTYQSGRCVATYAQPVYDNVRPGSVVLGRPERRPRREPEYHNVEAVRGPPPPTRRGKRPLLRDSTGAADYTSDVHSVTSRLSNVSVETNRSDPTDLRLSKYTSRSSMSGGSEDGHSPSHSSDYEDQDDAERSGSASLVGRMRGLRRDMQKKISRLKSPRGSTSSSPGPVNPNDKSGIGLPIPGPQQPAASSYESLPSSAPIASSTAVGSNRSSLSGEEAEPYTGPFIGRARALVDCQPSPYDRDALKFKKGDIIDIIAKNPSGLWKGCVDGRVGHFKFILVEEEVERPARRSRPWRGTTPRRGRACTLEELLTRLHLGHLIQVFVLNGYEDLEQFRDVEKADLDCLGITDPETCAKILTAVALLHDADSEPEQDLPETLETTEAALRRGDHGRDSGCYTDHRSTPAVALDENNLDTRQSTPSTDTSSGYHSRGAYNIPLGESNLTSRDDHSSALDSPSSESTATGIPAPSTAHSEPHSYRAHLATVLPASPRAKLRHSQQQQQQGDTKPKQESQVDFEAKYATARNVFEKEILKREVPFTVRSPKRSGGSQSPTEDLENGLKNDSSVAVEDEASP